MSDLVDRLKAACVGHPAAEIPWPHRLLHEAADELTALRAENERLKASLQSLYDEQNGAPVKRREYQWMRAMDRAREALGEWDSAQCECGHPLEAVRPGKFQPTGCCARVAELKQHLANVLAVWDLQNIAGNHPSQAADEARAALAEGEGNG